MGMSSLTPELMVEDIQATALWYQNNLGFHILFTSPETEVPSFARITRGSAEIMLFRRAEFAREIPSFATLSTGGSFVLYLEVDDIQTIWDQVKDNVMIVQTLHKTDYGTQEFTFLDPNGYHLMLSEKEGNEQS